MKKEGGPHQSSFQDVEFRDSYNKRFDAHRSSSGMSSYNTSSHSGIGRLKGGGVTRVYGNRPNLQDYKRKLDYRLGLVLLICLVTVSTILFIYGLYYEQIQGATVEYIQGVEENIHQAALTTSTLNSTESSETDDKVPEKMAEGSNLPLDVQSNGQSRKKREEEGTPLGTENTTEISSTTSLPNETQTTTPDVSESLTTTTVDPLSSSTASSLIDSDQLTLEELAEFKNRFQSAHIAIWVLAALNLMLVIFLVPLTYLFHIGYFMQGTPFKAIYRAVLVLILIFFFIQLFYLFDPLFTCSTHFPYIIDRLFIEGLPRPTELLEPMERRFACAFAYHDILVEYKIQEPCVPKLKDYLLPTYTVVLLILIDVFPFIFIVFTYVWDAKVKDWGPIRQARHRIELNLQKRPQSREEIVSSHTISREQSINIH